MDKTIKTVRGNPLAAEPLGRLLIKFAIPSVLSMLVDALYNIVDQIFIGCGVGYLGIAATTVTFPFVTILLSIATLLGIGGSVYTSMNLGAGKEAEAEKNPWNGIHSVCCHRYSFYRYMPYFPETAGTSFWGYEGGAGLIVLCVGLCPHHFTWCTL